MSDDESELAKVNRALRESFAPTLGEALSRPPGFATKILEEARTRQIITDVDRARGIVTIGDVRSVWGDALALLGVEQAPRRPRR